MSFYMLLFVLINFHYGFQSKQLHKFLSFARSGDLSIYGKILLWSNAHMKTYF